VAFQSEQKNTEFFEGDKGLEDSVVGGRRFCFAGLVAVGDRRGTVGLGYGKANEVPDAVTKGVADAKKSMVKVKLKGNTIPHTVKGRWGASRVILIPASEGTGVIAGKKLRPLLELAGIHDVLSKAYGSTSPKNLLKAGLDALTKLRTAQSIAALRGVSLT
jgi:small subunit ribosomal protein S5